VSFVGLKVGVGDLHEEFVFANFVLLARHERDFDLCIPRGVDYTLIGLDNVVSGCGRLNLVRYILGGGRVREFQTRNQLLSHVLGVSIV
jgi:hypothetical protein